jgi:hypothetical protein
MAKGIPLGWQESNTLSNQEGFPLVTERCTLSAAKKSLLARESCTLSRPKSQIPFSIFYFFLGVGTPIGTHYLFFYFFGGSRRPN